MLGRGYLLSPGLGCSQHVALPANSALILIAFSPMAYILMTGKRQSRKGWDSKMPQDHAAEVVLERLEDLKNHPNEQLTSYEEFKFDGKVYYFTPGGFLYRKEPGTEEVGGFFCGYLTDEVWQRRTGGG